MTAEEFIRAIRRAANENGGRPPGQTRLFRELGIARTDMWNAGFSRYSEALAAAAFVANTLNPALDRSTLLDSLGALTTELGRFPTKGDIKVARRGDANSPSYEAYFRLSGRSFPRLKSMLLSHCTATGRHPKVITLLSADPGAQSVDVDAKPRTGKRVMGYVYLVKHGSDFKLGRSNDVTRRRKEIALLLPDELEHVHIIETDDPEGIELYWQRRFAARRGRGEWFRLTAADVAAFKLRRYQ